MQTLDFLDLLAWVLIILGAIIIISGIVSMLMSTSDEIGESKRESKGIILIGPIPIVWGYGKQTWVTVAIIAIALFLIFWFL
ncbi:MAG: DUF131 domain-containing protein [Candidatus Thorarchaeota archaeon]